MNVFVTKILIIAPFFLKAHATEMWLRKAQAAAAQLMGNNNTLTFRRSGHFLDLV